MCVFVCVCEDTETDRQTYINETERDLYKHSRLAL